MLLKEIPGILPTLEDSPIAKSKLWERPIAEIIPHQLTALSWLSKEAGIEEADEYIAFLVNHARLAAAEGLIPQDTPLLSYRTRQERQITSEELVEGLQRMSGPMARAALFGLESDMSLERLMTLSYRQAQEMELSDLARTALRDQVRSISSDLAFWQGEGQHNALFGFAGEVYATFDMTWNSLRTSYKQVIPAHFGL